MGRNKSDDSERLKRRITWIENYISNSLEGGKISLEEFENLDENKMLLFFQDRREMRLYIFRRRDCTYRTTNKHQYERQALYGSINGLLRVLNMNQELPRDMTEDTKQWVKKKEWELNPDEMYIIQKLPRQFPNTRLPRPTKEGSKQSFPKKYKVQEGIVHTPRKR